MRRFMLAGGGDPEIESAVRLRTAALPNVDCEIGHVSAKRKHELLSMASVIVLPYTRFHSQSGVLADAYTYRLPLVVSDVGAIGPTIREDGTGEAAAPGSAAELAQAIARVLSADSGELEARLNAAAHQHDCRVVGPRLRAIYDLVMDGDRAHSAWSTPRLRCHDGCRRSAMRNVATRGLAMTSNVFHAKTRPTRANCRARRRVVDVDAKRARAVVDDHGRVAAIHRLERFQRAPPACASCRCPPAAYASVMLCSANRVSGGACPADFELESDPR